MGRSAKAFRKAKQWMNNGNRTFEIINGEIETVPSTNNFIYNIQIAKWIKKDISARWRITEYLIRNNMVHTAWDVLCLIIHADFTTSDFDKLSNITSSIIETKKGHLTILTVNKLKELRSNYVISYDEGESLFKLVHKHHPKYNSAKARILRIRSI